MIENEPDPLRRIPTKRPAEIKAEIGSVLKAARLKRGLSLDAAARQTRIPRRFLEALEENRFDEFPAFVYMRGFLKSYCDHLDAPFDQLWAQIQPSDDAEAAAPAAAPAPKTPSPAAVKTPAPSAPKTPAPAVPAAHGAAHAPAAGGAHADSHGSSAAGAVTGAIVLAFGVAFLLFGRRAPEAPKAVENTPRALMPVPRTVEPKVVLRALDDAWARVAVDDQVAFEGRVPRGAVLEWKPSKAVTIRTTAPTALAVTVNGVATPLANPGPDGDYRLETP